MKSGSATDIDVLKNDILAGNVVLNVAKSHENGEVEVLANNPLRYTAHSDASGFDIIPYMVCSDFILNCKICVIGTLMMEVKASPTRLEILKDDKVDCTVGVFRRVDGFLQEDKVDCTVGCSVGWTDPYGD